MHKIRENVWLGNYLDAQDIHAIQRNSITAVLNVAFEVEDPPYPPEQIRYAKVGLMDNNRNQSYMKELAVTVLKQFLEEGEVVLVHCAAGLSRAPYTIANGLAEFEKKTDKHQIWQDIKNQQPFCMWGALWEQEGYKPAGA